MRKLGFTLAEVLITVAILGVIAALTLPALNSDLQKQQWVQGLKTNYYDLQQGFERMMADQDVSDMEDTEIWMKYVVDGKYRPIQKAEDEDEEDTENENNSNIKTDFAKYFKFNDMVIDLPSNYNPMQYDGSELKRGIFMSQGDALIFNMANSALVVMTINKTEHGIASIVIDVNGYKGPNKVSKDIFLTYLQDDGTLRAAGVNGYWKTAPTDQCTDENFKSSEVDTGWYCTGRIIDEGWKMNY